jgi:hypothetical protein
MAAPLVGRMLREVAGGFNMDSGNLHGCRSEARVPRRKCGKGCDLVDMGRSVLRPYMTVLAS